MRINLSLETTFPRGGNHSAAGHAGTECRVRKEDFYV